MAAAAGVPSRTLGRRSAGRQRPTGKPPGRPGSGAGDLRGGRPRSDHGDPDGDPLARVSALVRVVPDFPEPGVVFRDITPVLADGKAFTRSPSRSRRWGGRPTSSSAWRPAGSCSAPPWR